jgi:predicted DNA-binding transcriptional regulator YafY
VTRRNRQRVRTLTLVHLLETGPQTLHELAKKLQVHRRTIQRDLRAIKEAGYFLTSHAPEIQRTWTEQSEPTRWWITSEAKEKTG